MLRWKIEDLAREAQVAPNTIVRFESDKGVTTTTLAAIERALLKAGIEFIAENGGGPGVRLRERER